MSDTVEYVYETNELGDIRKEEYGEGTHVYFLPQTGKKITKITCRKVGTRGNDEWGYTDVNTEERIQARPRVVEGIGCAIALPNETDPNWTGTQTITIEGENDYSIGLFVFGNDEHEEERIFSVVDHLNGGKWTYVYRKTASPHTYTKVMFFDQEYFLDTQQQIEMAGNELPSKWTSCSLQYNPNSEGYAMFSAYAWENADRTPPRKIIDSPFVFTPTMDEICFRIPSYDTQPRSAIIYVDSFLAIFSQTNGYQILSQEERLKANAKIKYNLYSTKKSSNEYNMDSVVGDELSVAGSLNFSVRLNGGEDDWKNLYPSVEAYEDYVRKTEMSGGGTIDGDMMVAAEDDTIPNEHRWVKIFADMSGVPISNLTHVVKYVCPDEMTDIEPIGNQVDIYPEYVRFTGYWLAKSLDYDYETYAAKLTRRILSSRETIDPNLKFQQYYPIFKPWAETHFVVHCETCQVKDSNGVVQKTHREPFLETTYTGQMAILHEHYQDNFVKEWKIKVNEDKDAREKLNGYVKTIAPFRNEMYLTHGGREEYDQQTYNPQDADDNWMGNCMILMQENLSGSSQTKMMSPKKFREKHDIMKYWNKDVKLGLFTQCCFAGGIQKGIQRTAIGNGIPSQPSDLLDGVDDMYFFVENTASHCGWPGRTQNLPVGFYLSGMPYIEVSNRLNNAVQKYKREFFKLISDFYNRNIGLMYSLLPNEDSRTQWSETDIMIRNDIQQNLGRRYFANEDWEKSHREGDDYLNSDNYFKPTTKEFPIHEGFVGLIEHMLLSMSKVQKNNPNRGYFVYEEVPVNTLEIPQSVIEKMKCFNGRFKNLKEEINELYHRYFSNISYFIALTEPTMKCFGKFEDPNAKFMKNPDEEEHNWLSSDQELAALTELGMVATDYV